eukprot:6324963-Pyramimonas_sp.AAC.1
MAKGAQTKQIMLWLADVVDRPGIGDTAHGHLTLALLRSMREYETIYANCGRIIPSAELAQSMDAVERAL